VRTSDPTKFSVKYDGYLASIPVNLVGDDGLMLYSLFSTSFEYYIDDDAAKDMFVAKEATTGQTKYLIPNKMLKLPKTREQTIQQLKFIWWESDSVIRLVDTQCEDHKIEKLVELGDGCSMLEYEQQVSK